jgi:hypothetical protein
MRQILTTPSAIEVDRESFPYRSLHEYLDDVLSGIIDPGHETIKQAKKDYWKLYYRHYRQQRRKVRKEFTLSFDLERLSAINLKKGNLGTSEFLYLIVDRELRSSEPLFNDDRLIAELDQLLMKLIALVEELLDDGRPESISDILDRLEKLETSFSQFIKQRS